MATTEETTERTSAPRASRRRHGRAGFSVRTRITVAVALFVAISLSAVGGVIFTLERARIERQAIGQADQELEEFDLLQEALQSADTGTTVEALLRRFLENNVPATDEIIVGWWDDASQVEAVGRNPGLTRDPDFLDAVRDLSEGGQRYVRIGSGEILLTVQPVRTQSADGTLEGDGALVLVNLLDVPRAALADLMRTYVIVAVLSLGAITTLAAWQAGRLLDPLRELNAAARQITESDLSRRIEEAGNDDISALTRTLNSMLDRLDHAFTTQRRFLDEAGHELRTPLTVLRGHLELVDAANPADVEGTRELLLEEIDRMSRLVGDMILLAKSSRPDFLEPTVVDLEVLTGTLLAKAAALGDRDWRADGTATGDVVFDEQRLTQAVLQLAGNAVKHTDPGAEIAIGSARDGDVVRVWVRDTGDGVPPEQREQIFRRFGRGSTRPGDEGFGLGLAIVGAIAEAHGGSLDLAETPPPGAMFVITIPVTDDGGPEAREAASGPGRQQPSAASAALREQPWPAS